MNTINEYLKKIVIVALCSGLSVMFGCNDDDGNWGDGSFSIEGIAADNTIRMSSDGTSSASDATGMSVITSGVQFNIYASGVWEIEPVDGEDCDWARIYPSNGKDEGFVRAYASRNPMAEMRSVQYRIVVNGTPLPELITILQEPSSPQVTVSTNNILLPQKGGSVDINVSANIHWEVEWDKSLSWLDVTFDESRIHVNANNANNTGDDLSAVIYLQGLGENSDVTRSIAVTQVDAIFSDDFSWIPDTSTGYPVCWAAGVAADCPNYRRIDQWPTWAYFTPFIESGELDEAMLTRWSAVSGTGSQQTRSCFKYLLLGSSANTGNLCSPAIAEIAGSVTAEVSWSMAGFVSKKNVRADCNDFCVSILGPGKIVSVTANGKSSARIATGEFTIPYCIEGSGTEPDVDLTEVAWFTIGSDGYFSMDDATGLLVWDNEETKFSCVVEGMTSETRIVFIGSEADKVTMLGGWATANTGNHSDSRKCFDNFKVRVK